MNWTEVVVGCDTCGFAGLVGRRIREYVSYRMAATAERSVRFAFCTACGVSCVWSDSGGPMSRQPKPLALGGDEVRVASWESVSDDSTPGACPGCGEVDTLLSWVPHPPAPLDWIACPCCRDGPLRLTDHRASHPGW